ncbi:MAG: hypothetical protein GY854_06660 [Deltaproteobacteria bacterium]|nr:hypothetical protein [Deltaproteobacteria bacterium]
MKLSGKRSRLLILLVAALGIVHSEYVGAFSVLSSVSDACHETITYQGGEGIVFDIPMDQGVVPGGEQWKKISRFLLEPMNLDPGEVDSSKRFMLTSLIIGSRAPDTDGHSILNLENLHRLHGDPGAIGQYAHALRGPDDDYAEGNASAVAGTRQLILELVEEGLSYLDLPPGEQLIKAPVYLDFYGRINVDVWAPLYYVGQAAHALQDSFSHTIRSDQDNLQKVVHVLNYVDAISSDFDEDRDGLAHSDSMDKCFSDDLNEIFVASVEATRDLLMAMRDQANDGDPAATFQVLEKWLTLKAGCTVDNEFCQNERWLEVVRREQTGPYMKEMFGCTVRTAGNRSNKSLGLIGLIGPILLP